MLHLFLTAVLLRRRRARSRPSGAGSRRAVSRAAQASLRRRHDPEIPRGRVRSAWGYDLALGLERRLAGRRPGRAGGSRAGGPGGSTAAWPAALAGDRPEAALVFSDVGSEFALPALPEAGDPVDPEHGPRRRPRGAARSSSARPRSSPDFFPLYLGDGRSTATSSPGCTTAGSATSSWPTGSSSPRSTSPRRSSATGPPRAKIRVIPYAADTRRFRPLPAKRHEAACTFLFAGGITQRKGIKYLLEAWRRVRRPGWRLQLLGALPRRARPAGAYLDEVELLGRVAPRRGARADGRGRRVRLPVAVRGLGRRHLRGAGLRPAERRHARARARWSATGSRASSSRRATSRRWPGGWSGWASTPGSRAEMAARARARAPEFDWPRYHAGRLIEALGAATDPRRCPAAGARHRWTRITSTPRRPSSSPTSSFEVFRKSFDPFAPVWLFLVGLRAGLRGPGDLATRMGPARPRARPGDRGQLPRALGARSGSWPSTTAGSGSLVAAALPRPPAAWSPGWSRRVAPS